MSKGSVSIISFIVGAIVAAFITYNVANCGHQDLSMGVNDSGNLDSENLGSDNLDSENQGVRENQ